MSTNSLKEQDVLNACIEFVKRVGGYVVRVNSGGVMVNRGCSQYRIKLAEPGTPDLIACISGTFIGIEVKRDEKALKAWYAKLENFKKTARITPYNDKAILQKRGMEAIGRAGGKAFIVCSVDMLYNDLVESGIVVKV